MNPTPSPSPSAEPSPTGLVLVKIEEVNPTYLESIQEVNFIHFFFYMVMAFSMGVIITKGWLKR